MIHKKILMAEKKYGNTASRAVGAEMAGWDVKWVEPYWADGLGRIRRGLQFRARSGPDISNWNNAVVRAAQQYRPTVMWVESPEFLFPDTLSEIKQKTNVTIVCAYSDDPRDPSKKSRHFDQGKQLYDVIFSTKDELLQRLFSEGVRCVAKFWKGFDPKRIKPIPMDDREYQAWSSDLLFIGHIDKIGGVSMRKPIVEMIAQSIPNFTVYGQSWGGISVSRLLKECIRPYQVDGIDYSKAICAAKIALQIPSRRMCDTHSSRSLEIPACGTLMLAERTIDHLMLFEEDKEAVFFSCIDELIDKADFYIKNESARKQIAQAGYKRCQIGGYSNYYRMQEMLAFVQRSIEKNWV